MRMHTIVTGENMDPKHIITKISVQQNPGRAAKVVGSKPSPQYSATQSKTYAPDGSIAQTKVNIKLCFELNSQMQKDGCFNSQYYIEQLGHDLTQHAKYLMGRDVHNFGMVKGERDAANSRDLIGQKEKPNQDGYKTEIMNIKLSIPQGFNVTVGDSTARFIMSELKKELEGIANNRLATEMRRNKMTLDKNEDLIQTRRQLAIMNSNNATLMNENQRLVAHIESLYVGSNYPRTIGQRLDIGMNPTRFME